MYPISTIQLHFHHVDSYSHERLALFRVLVVNFFLSQRDHHLAAIRTMNLKAVLQSNWSNSKNDTCGLKQNVAAKFWHPPARSRGSPSFTPFVFHSSKKTYSLNSLESPEQLVLNNWHTLMSVKYLTNSSHGIQNSPSSSTVMPSSAFCSEATLNFFLNFPI